MRAVARVQERAHLVLSKIPIDVARAGRNGRRSSPPVQSRSLRQAAGAAQRSAAQLNRRSVLKAFRLFGTAAGRYQVVVTFEDLEDSVRDESVRVRAEFNAPGNFVSSGEAAARVKGGL